MLRWLTAGESHGPSLLSLLDGVPAGIELTSDDLKDALARRRLGHGRGSRQKFEQDVLTVHGGLRHGLTLGSPLAIEIANSEWPKWEKVMSADPVPREDLLRVLAAVIDALAERDGAALAGRLAELDDDRARAVRRSFRSFGTCSISEPIDELTELGLVDGTPTSHQGAHRS